MNYSRISTERKRLGLNQSELADKIGISQKSISKYERGDRRPTYETLTAMSKLFNVSVDYLLGNTDIRNSDEKSTIEILDMHSSINYFIEKKGLNYSDIATKLGININLLKEYISGNLLMPYNILISLSELCDISTDCLLGIRNNSRNRDKNNKLPFQYNFQTSQLIKNLCLKTNTSITSLANILNLSEQEVHYLIEYGFIPHLDIIIKLTEYFHISSDFLLGRISEKEDKIQHTFHQLNEDNQDIIIGEMKKALKEQSINKQHSSKQQLRQAK